MQAFSQEEVKRLLEQPNGPEKLLTRAEEAFDAAWELFLGEFAPAGAFLARCAKRETFYKRMKDRLLFDRPRLDATLSSENAKQRKNAARLIGELDLSDAAPALIAALEKEEQRFVRPSLILALGRLGGAEASAFLNAYTVEEAADEGAKRHEKDEQEALFTARAALAAPKRHVFMGLKQPYALELRAPARLAEALCAELHAFGLDSARVVSTEGVRLTTSDMGLVMQARCFHELLFVASEDAALLPKSIAFQAKPFLEALLSEAHAGEPPFGFRVELRADVENRAALTKETAALLQGGMLVNAPGSYEAELRVEAKPHGGARLYAKLFTLPDERFSYRLGALPASIHPATAAAVLHYARPFLKENARVLDPFCGSGTMLIERERLMPCAALTGVDIAHAAIDIARENASAASSEAKFIVNDCLRFEAKKPYDEVIANLPFGNRVGTHAHNERLYAALLDKLPLWLKPGGTALLYTMEFTLLKKLLLKTPKLRLMAHERTEAGGLTPGIFILQNKG